MAGPVLLIHDDIAVIAPAKRVLQREGIDTLLVTNAADAVITFGDLAPPLVVVCPEVDGGRGASIVEEIRNHPKGPGTRFVFLGAAVPGPVQGPVVPLPLDGAQFVRTVRAALEGDSPPSWELAEPTESPPPPPPKPKLKKAIGERDETKAFNVSEKLLAELRHGDIEPEPGERLPRETPVSELLEDAPVPTEPGRAVSVEPAADPGIQEIDAAAQDLATDVVGRFAPSLEDVSKEAPLSPEAEAAQQAAAQAAEEERKKDEERRARHEAEAARAAGERRAAEEKARLAVEELEAQERAERQAAQEERARLEREKRAAEEARRKLAEADAEREADRKRHAEELERLRAEAERKRAEAKSQAEEEQRRLDEEKAKLAEEEARLSLELETQAVEQRERAAEEKRKLAEEQRRVALELEKQSAEQTRRLAEEKRKLADVEKRLADEKKKLAEEEERLGQERDRRLADARGGVDATKAKVEQLRREAEEAERRAAEEKKALDLEAQELARRRDEARKKVDEIRKRAEEDVRRGEEVRRLVEEAKKKGDEQRRRLEEAKKREEEERLRGELVAQAALEAEQGADAAKKRHDAARAEIGKRLLEVEQAGAETRVELEADEGKAEEAAREVVGLKRRIEEARRRAAEERSRAELLKKVGEEEEGKVEQELEAGRAAVAEVERRRDAGRARIEEQRRAFEAEREKADEVERIAEDERRKVAEARGKAELARLALEKLREVAEADQARSVGERERFEAESRELERLREEARAAADEVRARTEEAAKDALGLRAVIEEERRRVGELERAAADEERRAAEERQRFEEESARIAALREDLAKKIEEARRGVEEEHALRERDEARAREAREAAEKAGRERAQASLAAREEEVKRDQEVRKIEIDAIRRREEAAVKREGRRLKPFAAGRWRGAARLTETADRPRTERSEEPAEPSGPPLALEPAAEPGPEMATVTALGTAAPGEGFKTEPPAEPTHAPFPARGSLAALDPPTLVCRSWEGRVTGRIDIAGLDAQRTLWFEEGRLVAAASGSLVERLEDIALRAGLITAAQHHALRTSEEKLARRLALQMVELGYVRPAEMVPLVRKRVEEIAWSVFLDEESTYLFSPEAALPEERVVLPLHPYALATEGIRRKYSSERLHARLGGPSTLLRPREGRFDPAEFGFSAKERRIVAKVDGLKTIEELLFECGMDELAALKVLYALVVAGAAEIAVLGQAARAQTPEEAARLDLARVNEKYAHVLTGDYFQILGLRRDATSYEAREAYDRLCREFHPDRFVGLDDSPLFARLDEIGRALAEACDVLVDDGLRTEYARSLMD